jgi:hypothetical protein
MTYHAKLSPSGAHRWMRCAGSVVLEADKPDNSNAYSKEGTAAHAVAAMALTEGRPASAYIGRRVEVSTHETFEVTTDMAEGVQVYLDNIRSYTGPGECQAPEFGLLPVDLLVEQQVPIGHITGEEGATGTADAIIITDGGEELQVHDLKFGRGVEVDAFENEQLMLYALGALELVAPLGVEPKRVRMVIHQPRLTSAPSEWDCTIEVLQEFGLRAEKAARACSQEQADLNPGEKQCRFCKAKATCPALSAKVEQDVGASLDNLDVTDLEVGSKDDADLARKMAAIDLIEDWCKAVRAEVERRLLAGTPVPGYKLVQGRAGARAWSDATEAEEYLRKTVRLKVEQAYDMKLISPTTAEKLVKAGEIKPKQWQKLETLITRSEPKPSVAPATDKRPAIEVKPVIDSFEVIA